MKEKTSTDCMNEKLNELGKCFPSLSSEVSTLRREVLLMSAIIYLHHLGIKVPLKTAPSSVVWRRPRAGFLKLNTDGSFRHGASGGGGLIRNDQGVVLKAFHNRYDASSSLHSEILALRDGLQICNGFGWCNIIAETDSTNLIDCVENGRGAWRITFLIDEVQVLLDKCNAYIQYIPREANVVADCLAKAGANAVSRNFLNYEELSPTIRSTISLDSIQIPYIRL